MTGPFNIVNRDSVRVWKQVFNVDSGDDLLEHLDEPSDYPLTTEQVLEIAAGLDYAVDGGDRLRYLLKNKYLAPPPRFGRSLSWGPDDVMAFLVHSDVRRWWRVAPSIHDDRKSQFLVEWERLRSVDRERFACDVEGLDEEQLVAMLAGEDDRMKREGLYVSWLVKRQGRQRVTPGKTRIVAKPARHRVRT